ncbi:MAG: efflux transporter outer membrane subunit [Alphaproteobacteria bacterium]|nr:efflux transporter outer membrane subunit [Alphaproteobacteria bacterium]
MFAIFSRYRVLCGGVVTAALMLSGCAVGPDFKPPAPPEVERYTSRPLPGSTSSTDAAFGRAQRFSKGAPVSAKWWELYRSPALNDLVGAALRTNPNLQSQLAALRSAKELLYAQQGKFFPLVQGNFTPTRQAVPNNPLGSPPVVGTAPDGTPITQNPFNVFTAQVTVAYTLDVWGANRRAVESQQALAEAQRFQVEAAYIALTANLVIAAIQEAALRAQIDATREMVSANTKALDILRRQLDQGYANRNDVAVQEAALAQVVATLPPLQKQLAVQRDLIAALAGRFPSQLAGRFRLAAFRLPSDLPVSLPAQLVEQRPDVRAAEEQLHSASALVGVAVANMLPSFTINGARGYTSLELSNLISPPNIFWNIAGNATHTIFDGFTLLHQERAAQATLEQAAWGYRNTVIGAVQNVADTLQSLQADAAALKAARDFERAAKVSLDLAKQQLQSGNANVLLLLTAQTQYLQALIQVVQAQTNRLADTAALYVALGGGWWNRDGPTAPSQTLDVATGEIAPVADKPGWFPWLQ